jgi:hypothetical protein
MMNGETVKNEKSWNFKCPTKRYVYCHMYNAPRRPCSEGTIIKSGSECRSTCWSRGCVMVRRRGVAALSRSRSTV